MPFTDQLVKPIHVLLLEDTASIPLWHYVSDVLVKPRIKGYVPSPMGVPLFHLLSLEDARG